MTASTTYASSREALELAAALLESHPDYRVTRALTPLGDLVLPAPEGRLRKALVIDTETTGLDWRTGRIIEVAACPVTIDGRARIVAVDTTIDWLEDPGQPLSPEIARLTGLSDADLAGRHIDDAAMATLIDEAAVVIAHNAAFDRRWWEARWPSARHKPWACSMAEIDWRGHGYEGRSLGVLLDQAASLFNRRHRADADVDALVTLLATTLPGERTAASELLLRASRPTWAIGATGAPYAVKEALRARGYRWNTGLRVWRIEVAEHARDDEIAWLAAEAGCRNPSIAKVTWFDRHR